MRCGSSFVDLVFVNRLSFVRNRCRNGFGFVKDGEFYFVVVYCIGYIKVWFLVGVFFLDDDLEVGQGSKFCLVVIGRLQVISFFNCIDMSNVC